LGNAYFFNGWYEEAVNAYKSAILLNPENAGYRYALAYIYYEYKEFDKAKKEVESILSIDNNNYQAKVLKALLLCKDGKLIEAEKILQENMSLGVCDEFTISSLATVELELGKYKQAEEHLKSLLENKPFNPVLTQQLCEVYIKEKSYDKALELAENITNNDQNSIDGNLLGAKAALYANKFELVKNYAQEILSKDINCAEGYYYLAMARKYEKDYPEAIECMKRAILHDLNNAGYYAVTAELYKFSGDNETAFEYIKEAESIDNSEEYKRLFKEYAALNRK
jgi:tetratricopeptide (TPR) repeat protein